MRSGRKAVTSLFFILSSVFMIFSLPYSGALSYGKMKRDAYATVVNDGMAFLELHGFENQIYDFDKDFECFGSITNNSEHVINLMVTIHSFHIAVPTPSCHFRIKIGETDVKLKFTSGVASPEKIELNIEPGQCVDVQALLKHNQEGIVIASFQFEATDAAGKYTVKLNDTLKTPRRIICF